MLSYRLLKNHAGVLLTGDYVTLRKLHEIVCDVDERSPFLNSEDSPLLNLAHDTRMAYELQREILAPPDLYAEMGPRYGVQILWPALMVYQRTLRVSLGYIDHSKAHQAILYALEALMEDALKEAFGTKAPAIMLHWQRIDPAEAWPLAKFNSRCALFCALTKAERRTHLATLLQSLHPIYPSFYAFLEQRGDADDRFSPAALDAWDDARWVNPRW